MGFVLSILYFVTYYLTPDAVFGPLAQYRVQLIFAVLATLASIPALKRSPVAKTPQSVALIGLAISTFLSVLISMRWLSGAITGFMVNAVAYSFPTPISLTYSSPATITYTIEPTYPTQCVISISDSAGTPNVYTVTLYFDQNQLYVSSQKRKK